jgi:hypothetical protein
MNRADGIPFWEANRNELKNAVHHRDTEINNLIFELFWGTPKIAEMSLRGAKRRGTATLTGYNTAGAAALRITLNSFQKREIASLRSQ